MIVNKHATHNSSSQQRVHAIMTDLSQLKLLELGRQHRLDILGIDREDVIATEVAQDKGSDVAVLSIANNLHASLRQLGQQFLLIRSERLLQIIDSKGILARVQRQVPTAQTLGLARVLP